MPHPDRTLTEKSLPPMELLRRAFKGRCPRCGEGALYKPGYVTTSVCDHCDVCGLRLAEHDSADGPAVFLIFVLGFSIVPAALLLEKFTAPPMWVHVLLWGAIATAFTLGALRPLKALVIGIQYKYRPGDWKDS